MKKDLKGRISHIGWYRDENELIGEPITDCYGNVIGFIVAVDNGYWHAEIDDNGGLNYG